MNAIIGKTAFGRDFADLAVRVLGGAKIWKYLDDWQS